MLLTEKCPYHDELKQEMAELTKIIRKLSESDAVDNLNIQNFLQDTRDLREDLKEIKKCMHDLNLKILNNYVTKIEFENFCKLSEERIIRAYEKMEQKDKEIDNNVKVKNQETIKEVKDEIGRVLKTVNHFQWKVAGLYSAVILIIFSFMFSKL